MRSSLHTVRRIYPWHLWSCEALAGIGAGGDKPTPVFHNSATPRPPTASRPSASFLPQSKHKEPSVEKRNGEGGVSYPPGKPTPGLRLGKREPVPFWGCSSRIPSWESCFAFQPPWAWFWPLAFATFTPSIATSGG